MREFRLWAHRGGGAESPENTDQALAATAALGYGWIETDLQLTADGEVVLQHNPDLQTPYRDPRLVADLTWAELSQLRTNTGAAPLRLQQALADFPQLFFNLEPKTMAVLEPAWQIVSAAGALDRTGWATFSPRLAFRLAALAGRETDMFPGHLGCSPLGVGIVKIGAESTLPIGRLLGMGRSPRRLQIPLTHAGHKLFDQRLLAYAHRCGMAVDIWTINDFAQAWELYQQGVDGIMTDYPALFAEQFQQRGVKLARFA